MSSSRENMQRRREIEIKAAAFDRDAILEIYETDADLILGNLVYQGFCRDTAETKMCVLFQESGYGTDYLLYNRKTMDIITYLLTPAARMLRGECQG